jgi:hypothetical protein
LGWPKLSVLPLNVKRHIPASGDDKVKSHILLDEEDTHARSMVSTGSVCAMRAWAAADELFELLHKLARLGHLPSAFLRELSMIIMGT